MTLIRLISAIVSRCTGPQNFRVNNSRHIHHWPILVSFVRGSPLENSEGGGGLLDFWEINIFGGKNG